MLSRTASSLERLGRRGIVVAFMAARNGCWCLCCGHGDVDFGLILLGPYHQSVFISQIHVQGYQIKTFYTSGTCSCERSVILVCFINHRPSRPTFRARQDARGHHVAAVRMLERFQGSKIQAKDFNQGSKIQNVAW